VNRRAFLVATASLGMGQNLVGELPVTLRSCYGPFTVTLNWIRAFWDMPFPGEPKRTTRILSFFEAIGVAFAPRRGLRIAR